MERLSIILNPASGGGKARETARPALDYFDQQGMEYRVLETREPRHAEEIAAECVRRGEGPIVCAGGDGLVFETVNGAMAAGGNHPPVIGVLPAGTGNALAGEHGIETVLDAAERIAAGKTRPLDVGRIQSEERGGPEPVYFVNMIGCGLLARGCRAHHDRFFKLGKWSYHAAFFWLFWRLRNDRYLITADGTFQRVFHSPLLAVCNTQYTGRNLRISPRSDTGDGRFELLYTEPLSRLRILRMFRQLSSGDHIHHPSVHYSPVKSLTIQTDTSGEIMVDGELLPYSHFHVDILAGAARFLA